MAIINNNVQNVQFLRNQTLFESRDAARQALEDNKGNAADGSALLARYSTANGVKTLVGLVAEANNTKYVTIIDVEGGSSDVQELREEINAKLGNGISSANTATAQLSALSGSTFVPGTSSSADTSVEGAKAYAYDLVGTLDGGITAETGSYVKSVSEVDGKISGTTAELPTVTGEVESKKVVMSVSEDKGEISVDKGTIESSDNTIIIGDVEESNVITGIDFKVNIDNETLIADTGTGVISVASAALTQYIGDGKTIEISAPDADNNKTVSTLLTLASVSPSSEIVNEEYALKNASGETIGSTIKIYKDSHIVSIEYQDDPEQAYYQNLIYTYIDASGNTQVAYVDISELVLEAEFASGVTVTNHVAHGVVDPASELDSNDVPFLTVGADGFKISGIKNEIAAQLGDVVADLDANVSGNSTHVTVNVVEENGVITGVNVEEDNIANADDLAELSGKTITAITSTNGSITTSIDDAVGNKSYNIETDASKIKMSGFTSTGVLSGISESSSITEAFSAVEGIIESNERVISESLNDLNERIEAVSGDVETISGNVNTISGNVNTISGNVDTISGNVNTISGDVDTIKNEYISGVSVNGNAVTVANKVAPISITAATSATTATSTEAITVQTDANGNITLGISSIDCGYYS